MSVFRMLSPVRGASHSPSRKAADTVQIDIRVPSYGTVCMPFPDPLAYHSDSPRNDKELFGDLEILIPAGMGRQKCKAIRVGVRTVAKLDMGRGKPEEDVLYEGKVEVRGGTADGVVLEEGLQRFTFNIIIPGNLAPHDYHPGHRVDNILFAEIEGVEETGLAGWFRRGSSPSSSTTTSRGTTPSSSPRLSPLRPGSGPSSPVMSPTQSLSILRQEIALPQPPAYDLSAPEEVIPWLSGNHYVERALILIYNPDPAGGVSSLDTRMDTAAPGVGPVSISYVADQVSPGDTRAATSCVATGRHDRNELTGSGTSLHASRAKSPYRLPLLTLRYSTSGRVLCRAPRSRHRATARSSRWNGSSPSSQAGRNCQ